MQDIHYTDAVGYKFNRDGTFKQFIGATIVSHLDTNSNIFTEVEVVSKKIQETDIAYKYAFLPAPSYHMTNFVLYNDHPSDRVGKGWSTKIQNDTPSHVIDKTIYDMLSSIIFPQSYCMKLKNIADNSFRIIPATKETAETLSMFRDACAEATGIYFPDHETYEFHISYAYNIITLNTKEKTILQNILMKETKRIQSILPEFEIPAPEYCTFNDMSHFEPYRG